MAKKTKKTTEVVTEIPVITEIKPEKTVKIISVTTEKMPESEYASKFLSPSILRSTETETEIIPEKKKFNVWSIAWKLITIECILAVIVALVIRWGM